MAAPPSLTGGPQVAFTVWSPAVAATSVGAPGGDAAGVTLPVVAAGPSPMALVAVTVAWYCVPFVTPSSALLNVYVLGSAASTSCDATVVSASSSSVTVYLVMAVPPSLAGTAQVTVTVSLP